MRDCELTYLLFTMDVYPTAAYRKVTMTLNGVTKSVVVPVPSYKSRQNQKNTCESDDYSDDECIIMDVEASGPLALSEGSPLLNRQHDPDSLDLDVEPFEISPVCDTIDLTLSPEKTVASCEISQRAQNSVTDRPTTDVTWPASRIPVGIVVPINLFSSASTSTDRPAKEVVVPETQQVAFPSATIFRNVARSSQVNVSESELQKQFSHSQLSSSGTSAVPLVIAPPPSTDVSSFSGISLPRTMTKQEAVAAGWFTDEDRAEHFHSTNAAYVTQPTRTPYSARTLSSTMPLMNSLSVEPVAEDNFVASAEFVSLETLDITNGNSTSAAAGIGNHVDIVPLMSNAGQVPCSYGISENSVTGQPEIEIDVALDRKPQLVAKETKLHTLQELLHYSDDEDDYDYDRLLSEEDEPLTAVMEGIDNDNSTHGASTEASPLKKTAKKTTSVKRGRGRPPKLKLPVQETYKAKRTGGRPLTAAERYRLKDCGVLLQQLKLSAATVKIRAVWRYLCCRDLVPRDTRSCSLCDGRQKSDGLIELEVSRKFRAGIWHCRSAVKTREFSLDSELLPDSEITTASEAKKSPAKISPSKTSNMSDNNPGLSPQGNKKYLVIRTETGTFVVPVDSAVGCIVSEQEVAKMICSQPVSSLSLYAGEFSNDTLRAACSSNAASPSDKPSYAEARDEAASAAERSVHVRRRKSSMSDDFHYSSLSHTQRKTETRSVTNTGAVKQISKRKHFSNASSHKKCFSFCKGTMKRELRALGLSAGILGQRTRTRHKAVRS